MELTLGADVYYAEGLYGRLTHIVLNPKLRWVTHLVVKEKGQKQRERILSVKYIEQATPKEIHLICTKEAASHFQPFEVSRYVHTPTLGADISVFWSIDRQAEHYFPSDGTYIPIKTRAIPLCEVAVNQDVRVEATNGMIGRLRGFQVNPLGWKITHLILHKGHIWSQEEVAIPTADIESIGEKILQLKLDKKGIKSMNRRLSKQGI